MSQTPTKGPYKLEQWQQPDGTDLHCVCHSGTVCPATTVANFTNEADALLLLAALNIHRETKQTPRQILESREFEREMKEATIDQLNAARSLYPTIIERIAEFWPDGARDLDYDILPGSIRGKISTLLKSQKALLEALKEAEGALHFCVKAQIGTANDWSKSTPRVALEIVTEALTLAKEGGQA